MGHGGAAPFLLPTDPFPFLSYAVVSPVATFLDPACLSRPPVHFHGRPRQRRRTQPNPYLSHTQTSAFQTLDVLQEHGIAANDIQKLQNAGYHTVESVRIVPSIAHAA